MLPCLPYLQLFEIILGLLEWHKHNDSIGQSSKHDNHHNSNSNKKTNGQSSSAVDAGAAAGSRVSLRHLDTLLRSALTLVSDWLSWTVVGSLEALLLEQVTLIGQALHGVRQQDMDIPDILCFPCMGDVCRVSLLKGNIQF